MPSLQSEEDDENVNNTPEESFKDQLYKSWVERMMRRLSLEDNKSREIIDKYTDSVNNHPCVCEMSFGFISQLDVQFLGLPGCGFYFRRSAYDNPHVGDIISLSEFEDDYDAKKYVVSVSGLFIFRVDFNAQP
jgi:hypothetical protein